MHLSHCHIVNFRRMKDVHIDLESDITIFVGANNSGKTSAAHAVQMFASEARFGIHDFNSECWKKFDETGSAPTDEGDGAIPSIALELWFAVDDADLHRVIDLLPSLDWSGSLVGIRIEYCAKDSRELLHRFRESQKKAQDATASAGDKNGGFRPWPASLTDYLKRRLEQEFELRYFVLNPAHFDNFEQKIGHTPDRIIEGMKGGHVLKRILRVDCLNAQRHLSDAEGGARAEDLSRRMSKFYKRNLAQRESDYDALQALAQSEAHLNAHFADVFESTLRRLAEVGYPGLDNPRLLIRSALNPEAALGSAGVARVHYEVGDGGATLPERYNGLGFKNLIYMVVELLDLHARWLDDEDEQVPLHLIFIEEPEAHLHVQLQQVFIRKVLDILVVGADAAPGCCSQVVVTTHSPHILYERGFRPIRYFRRMSAKARQESQVLSVSKFCRANEGERDFLERYMRLSHCDLFFADAAILVEGNVERLMMPLMIEKAAPLLRGAYLSILEVGGAFGYRFKSLIDFLGMTTLVVTDIDSVHALPGKPADAVAGDTEEENPSGRRKACPVDVPDAVTCNQTLIQWLPKKAVIRELLAAAPGAKTSSTDASALVRVAYQVEHQVNWNGETARRAGRTFEEAFALENLPWCQDGARAALGLRIARAPEMKLDELAAALFERVKSSTFKKTDFALAVLLQEPGGWVVPFYIAEGLNWLSQVTSPEETGVDVAAAQGRARHA
jgi:predicted ATP-dependent endonuclease of OLD family